MPTVADVLRRYGGEYLERFGTTMPPEHKKVLRAITACRTGAPAAARIDPNTGAFIWTPSAPGKFTVTVRVTDESSPELTVCSKTGIRT